MAVDWAQVAADYQRSTLDIARVEAEARRTAEALTAHGAAFDGYTDDEAQSFWKEAGVHGFFSTLLKDRTGIDYQHIGYWLLESVSETSYDKERKKTRIEGFGGQKSFSIAHNSLRMSRRIWAILSDGRLATYSRFNFTSTRIGKSEGRGWIVMTTDDVLVLDHRVRSHGGQRGNKWSSGWDSGTSLSTENHLLTGKKGGGCLKLIASLRERKGVQADSPRQATPQRSVRGADTRQSNDAPRNNSTRQRPPIAKTYELAPDQLRDGTSIRHAFAGGTNEAVKIYPGTRSGKVIIVRPRAGGAAESIRIVSR